MDKFFQKMKPWFPWLMLLLLGTALVLMIPQGWWQANASPAQVQVPMFYDAHYLFPRPWTQEQMAPGVPDPAPLSFAYPDQVSQQFVSGVNNLAMVEVWLSGSPESTVSAAFNGDDGSALFAEIPLHQGQEGGLYQFTFDPLPNSKGTAYTITLSPSADSVGYPLGTRTVGGDRLGGSLNLNGYNQPGNLFLRTYARGKLGAWWLQSIGQQLLPSIFRLRIEQFKPTIFKGPVFTILLIITAGLSLLFLFLARPQAKTSLRTLSQAAAWTLVLILGLFLLSQIGGSRFKPGFENNAYALSPAVDRLAASPVVDGRYRVTADYVSDLWTAEREPEARFIKTGLVDGFPAIRTPADSRLTYPIVIPPGGQLSFGTTAAGQGRLETIIEFNDERIYAGSVAAEGHPLATADRWQAIDLSPWAGQTGFLSFTTKGSSAGAAGLWLWPRLATTFPWLYPDPLPSDIAIRPADFQFENKVALIGYTLDKETFDPADQAKITLYWRSLSPLQENMTVFVHLLDGQGNLVAQDDAPPVSGAYPPTAWQVGTIIADDHTLAIPQDLAPGSYSLAVGLYDPQTFGRWAVANGRGQQVPDGRAFLPGTLEVQP